MREKTSKKDGENSIRQLIGGQEEKNDRTKAAPFHNYMRCRQGGGVWIGKNGRHSTSSRASRRIFMF
jgi:hypothetical protein